MSIAVKRVYDLVSADDGYRVLVDRLWPRGLSHAMARLDLWLRDIAPSTQLRVWFGHDPERWPEFRSRYRRELERKAELLDRLLALQQQHERLTLLFGARDRAHNEAEVLASVLRRRGRAYSR